MDPDLVCKILVTTPNGKKVRGSGYPITRDRIITAAHVVDTGPKLVPVNVDDASSAQAKIELYFGPNSERVDCPCQVIWTGATAGIDVAILSCELPDRLQPTHLLPIKPLTTPTDWFAHGYTEFRREKLIARGDHQTHPFEGRFPSFSAAQYSVSLGCTDGLDRVENWKGGSGSCAFDSTSAQWMLAVITRFESGHQLDHFIAVPICNLLGHPEIGVKFSRAIRMDEYRVRHDRREAVVAHIASQLSRTGKDLNCIAKEISHMSESNGSQPHLNLSLCEEELAKALAKLIVEHCHTEDVVGTLVGTMDVVTSNSAEVLADVLDHLLPLNYSPQAIDRMRERISKNGFGLLDREVATRTLAEIIMAGHDDSAAKFLAPSQCATGDVPGQTALDCGDVPEEGPEEENTDSGAPSDSQWRVLLDARNLLRDLIALKDRALGLASGRGGPVAESSQNVDDLKREIQEYSRRLAISLKSTARIHRGRRLYCVFAPARDEAQRIARQAMIGEVASRVKDLLFVELTDQPGDRELEIRDYIIARLVRAQSKRQP